jgi:hypothetical protein
VMTRGDDRPAPDDELTFRLHAGASRRPGARARPTSG